MLKILVPLKNWAAPCVLFMISFCATMYQVTDENTMPKVKTQQENEKKMKITPPKSTYPSQYGVKEMHLPAGLDSVHQ